MGTYLWVATCFFWGTGLPLLGLSPPLFPFSFCLRRVKSSGVLSRGFSLQGIFFPSDGPVLWTTCPHSGQKRLPGSSSFPQFSHRFISTAWVPQSGQNLAPSFKTFLHFGQYISLPPFSVSKSCTQHYINPHQKNQDNSPARHSGDYQGPGAFRKVQHNKRHKYS